MLAREPARRFGLPLDAGLLVRSRATPPQVGLSERARRSNVRSAFALLVVLFTAAALYAVMKADFIAAAQVLIYVGGILVLIIFAVISLVMHLITGRRS